MEQRFVDLRDKIKGWIREYHLQLPLGMGIIFFIFDRILSAKLYSQKDSIVPPELTLIPLRIMFIFIVLVTAVLQILSRKYNERTGRNLIQDRLQYGLSLRRLFAIFQEAENGKLETGSYKKQDWTQSDGVIFGNDKQGHLISLPSDAEGNIAVYGPPGSGKTAGVAIPAAMQFKGSVLAVDIKGDIYNYVSRHTHRKIIRFCPDHPDALEISAHYDPLQYIREINPSRQKRAVEAMACTLIPNAGGNDTHYFTDTARTFFQGILFLLMNENPEITFPDVIHQILSGNIFNWVKRSVAGDCQNAKEKLDAYYGNNEKNVTGAYSTLTQALDSFADPLLDQLLQPSQNSISIKQMDAGYDLYLQVDQANLEVYAPLMTLIINQIMDSLTRRPDKSTGIKTRPILFLLDEFPQLTFSYGQIGSALSTLRSKRVQICIIQQNMAQLTAKYNEAQSRSLIGNCNYQFILGSNDAESSRYFSALIGSKTRLKINESLGSSSRSKNLQENIEPVYRPEYFSRLPSTGKGILYAKGKYIELTKINCYIQS
jgi:type IV secretion system protein VirD4